jgi:MFS transporter, OPA family, sugar phosphate sensor protein UhpC
VRRLIRLLATGPDRPVLEDKAEVDRIYRRRRLAGILAVTLGYGFSYTCRLGLASVKKRLIDARLFDADQLGTVGQTFFFTYATGKLANGFLGDHANVRRLFSLGVFCSALANLSMGLTRGLWVWAILWAINGWFQSCGAPTGAVVLASWFSNSERGRYYGIFSASHSFGEGLSFLLLGVLVTEWGWRLGFIGPAVLCLVVAALLSRTLSDRPQTMGLPPVASWRGEAPSAPPPPKPGSTLALQLQVLRTPAVWVLGLANACLITTRYAINSWGWLYLQDRGGYSQIEAGALLALNTACGVLGSASFGFLSDKLFKSRRPPVNLIFGALELVALSLLFFGPRGSTLALYAGLLLYGFSLNGLLASLGGLFAIDLSPKLAAGAAMGFVGVFSYLGAGIQERVSGYLIQRGTTYIDGVRHCDYSAAVTFWFGAAVASMILAASLWRQKMRD